jgi:hypothetical protein
MIGRKQNRLGRSYNNEPQKVDPDLVEFARYAASLIAIQAPDALEDVSSQGFLTRQDKRRGHHFEGQAFAQRALRSPNAHTDTTLEYLAGDITDAKRAQGIKFPVIGKEHRLAMQGVHRVLEPAPGVPVGHVAYQLEAGMDDGQIQMIVQRTHAGPGAPLQERLNGVDAWKRAMPLIRDLPGTFRGDDPYRDRTGEPAFPTFRHEISEEALAPLFEEWAKNDPDFQQHNPFQNFPHHPDK